MSRNGFQVYAGDGTTINERQVPSPEAEHLPAMDDPARYLAEPGLRDAVNVALALGQPLLVTGEPGTGKTQLAASIAHELGFGPPLMSHVKTTSTASDLFYRYDALRHFHDAQFKAEGSRVDDYIEYDALGLAILLANGPKDVNPYLPEALRDRGPVRSVVLVDEIDKAPRDLPNDVLNELEQMAFTVKETGRTFRADRRFQPIVVLTSNSERTLPDAFLRRCVFYHLSFPDRVRLLEIVKRRLEPNLTLHPDKVRAAIEQFEDIRKLTLKKKPATAELLAWLRVLNKLDIDVKDPGKGDAETIAYTYSLLAKTREDLSLLQERFAGESQP